MVILGVDPGSRITGFGVVQWQGNVLCHLSSGSIALSTGHVSHRLSRIYQELSHIMREYAPQTVAIEQVFMHVNPAAALKLGQARGAAIVALAAGGLDVAEYSARQVKQAVVGYGAASKEQVQLMVRTLLRMTHTPAPDAADALAIAICHAHVIGHSRSFQQSDGVCR